MNTDEQSSLVACMCIGCDGVNVDTLEDYMVALGINIAQAERAFSLVPRLNFYLWQQPAYWDCMDGYPIRSTHLAGIEAG